jgi:hypothetical protein
MAVGEGVVVRGIAQRNGRLVRAPRKQGLARETTRPEAGKCVVSASTLHGASTFHNASTRDSVGNFCPRVISESVFIIRNNVPTNSIPIYAFTTMRRAVQKGSRLTKRVWALHAKHNSQELRPVACRRNFSVANNVLSERNTSAECK